MEGEDNLFEAARLGTLDQIPKGLLAQEKLTTPDELGWNILHMATANKHLYQIPEEFLTLENLQEGTGNTSWNCFHLAADRGCLGQIPKKFLTPKNLLNPKVWSKSAFFWPLRIYFQRASEDTQQLEFNPREWIPYLSGLEGHNQETFSETGKKELNDLIQRTKVVKALGEEKSLKI